MATNSNVRLFGKLDGLKLASGQRSAFNSSDLYPAANFVSQRMPMHVVRPRPNSEASTYDYDHNGYVGIPKEIRVCIQGGSYPFMFTIVKGPALATINNNPNDRDYGVFKYTPSALGNDEIIINAVDQSGTSRIINWTINVNVDWVRFVSPTGSNAAAGTEVAPWQTLTYAMAQSIGGRALCLMDGTYTDLNGSCNLIATGVNTMFARNKHMAIVDCATWSNTGNTVVFWGNSNNAGIYGIQFHNPPNVVANPRWFHFSNNCSGSWQDSCKFFINGRLGTDNTDNISCFFLSDLGSSAWRLNISQTRCDFDGFAGAPNGWSTLDTYTTRYLCIEKNLYSNQVSTTTGAGYVWIKASDNRYVSIRQNEFTTAHAGALIDVQISNRLGDDRCGYVEVCYNVVRTVSDSAGIEIMRGTGAGRRLPCWSYRNTVLGHIRVYKRSDQPLVFESIGDVLISSINAGQPFNVVGYDSTSGTPVIPVNQLTNTTVTVSNYECHLPSNAGAVDSACRFTGSYKTNWEGKRGHWISK